MKKLLLSILVASIGTFVSNAQLLWEVTGNGLSKPSYLFGTHHIAPVSVMDSVPGFASALASADKVYGEMVMSEAQTPKSQQVMLTYAMAPQDSTLTSVLSAAQLDSQALHGPDGLCFTDGNTQTRHGKHGARPRTKSGSISQF